MITPSQAIALLVFLGIFVGIYVATASIGVRWLLRVVTGRKAPARSPARKIARAVVLVGAVVGIGCFAYGYFVEPNRLIVRRERIESDKLSPGHRPIRIVHISDLHCDPDPRLEPELPGVVKELKPDLIVFTGDAANTRRAKGVFISCMAELAKLAPLIGVRGNWDMGRFWQEDLFRSAGVAELEGVVAKTLAGDVEVQLVGAAWGRTDALHTAVDALRPDRLTILLYHMPDEMESIPPGKVDLYLAGHTHGGQVALPLYGAMLTLSRLGKRFEGGMYRVGDTWLNVSRGIGMEGGRVPRVRFCSRPEVVLIEIHPAGSVRRGVKGEP